MSREEKTQWNRRVYNTDKLKEDYDKLVEEYKNRTDLDVPHPTYKLKWWQRLFKPKQR